jgi:hypothetical protein
MDHRPLWPFSYNEDEHTPVVALGSECIRMVLRQLEYDGDRVSFHVHLAFMFPTDVALRYRRPEEAIVLVVRDIDQRAGFAQRTRNDFMHIHYAPGERLSPNCIGDPALPLPGRGDPQADSYRGGYVAGALGFSCPRPALKPSIHVHAILENFVSNRFALDLIDMKIIDVA